VAHRIGIIGLGFMGEWMLRRAGRHPDLAVVAGWDPAPHAAATLRSLLPEARFARDAADLVADPAVTCVYIAAPPDTHLAYANLAFDHGKAVFSEPPFATDPAACRALVARVERERHSAALNFSFASAPAVRAIASGLKSGELGGVVRVEIELAFSAWPRPWQDQAAWVGGRRQGGFAREVLSHFVFLTQRLLGPLRLAESRVELPADDGAAETALWARLEVGTVPVQITARIGGESADFNRWNLLGRQGAFELHDWYSLRRRINGGWLDIDFGEGPVRELSHRAQLDALAALLDGRPHGLPSLREGVAAQEIIEAMLQRG
jgi:predicted dehydrogenase